MSPLGKFNQTLLDEPDIELGGFNKLLLGSITEPEEEPTWWETAWGGIESAYEWLYPRGIQDIPRQYGAALQRGGMAAGEAMTWLARQLPGQEDLAPYGEQPLWRQGLTVAQVGASIVVGQELIRAGVTGVKDLKLNLKTLFTKEQSKPVSEAINEIYKSVVGRPLSNQPEAIQRYRAILAYKKDLPSSEVTRLTNFINKTITPSLPSPGMAAPTPTVTPTAAPTPTAIPSVAVEAGTKALNIYLQNPEMGLTTINDLQLSLQKLLPQLPTVVNELVTMGSGTLPIERRDVLGIVSENEIDYKTEQQLHNIMGTSERPKEVTPEEKIVAEAGELEEVSPYGEKFVAPEPEKEKQRITYRELPTGIVKTKVVDESMGIDRDWGTQNIWFLNNPYREQLLEMRRTGKYDADIFRKADRWEMEQVLKDKPAFLNNTLSEQEVLGFAKKYNLSIGYREEMRAETTEKTRIIVVAQDKDKLQRVLDAETNRDVGLALGYRDISVVAPEPEAKPTVMPEIAPKAEVEKVAPIDIQAITPEEFLATPKQIRQAHIIARSKAMITDKGKMKPQYRKLAEMIVGKKSITKMTKDEAIVFIDALNKLPEPTRNKKGELVPPSIPKTTELVPKEFFERKFKEPTVAKYLTSQTYYAEILGIKPLVEPSEIGKQKFDLEFRGVSKTVDQAIKKIDIIGKTTAGEKIVAKIKNRPTEAVVNMAQLLNKYEEPPETLSQKEKDVFNWFRSLNREILKRENEVRGSLGFEPIEYREAYLRHTADTMAKEMLKAEYPFPQGLKYWSEKIIGKKIFNPMEFQRKLSDDLIDLWTKDLAQATKSMLWSGLKEIHLAEPVNILSKQLNALSRDTKVYKDLSPEEKMAYEKSVIPASTKKWLINYENQVIKGQQTELDANVNRIVTESGLKGLFNKVLSPFGRTIGEKPITDSFQFAGRLTISGVMGWIPRQIIRNTFQSVQNLALYGVKATTKALLPVSITNDENLKELLTDSVFLKSYTGFEELPANLMGKMERVWLAPYGAVAVFNAKTAMKAAYWDTLDLVKNPKYKDLGWADPKRTKDTQKDYLYPSEKEKLLKEMEFGAGATQYQYIPIGMPELFRQKTLIPLTRLQSWWMNYFAKFTRESLHRAFKGETSYGAKLPWSRRVNYLKYLLIGGAILTGMGYKRSFLIGVLPTYLSPAGQVALGLYTYATAKSDWQRQKALRQIQYSWSAFIPGSLAWKDFMKVWNGEKELKELFFYKKPEKKEKKKAVLWY